MAHNTYFVGTLRFCFGGVVGGFFVDFVCCFIVVALVSFVGCEGG